MPARAATSHMTRIRDLTGNGRRRHSGAERADQELAVDADVPDTGAQSDEQSRADDQQRRHLDERLGDAVGGAETAIEQHG